MGSRCPLAGIEVPIIGSDSVKWTDLSLPPSPSAADSSLPAICSPLSADFASSSAVSDPPIYVTCRVHKSSPYSMELLELCADKEFPRNGLRFIFPNELSASVFVCKNEVDVSSRTHYPYLVYALTVSGIAYLLSVKNVSAYKSSSVFPPEDVICAFDMQSYGVITSAAAMSSGCLVVGRSDGSVGCFQLGTVDRSAPAPVYELRDDLGINRLWSIMSRGRVVEAVQDLVVSKIHGKQILFVLHSDGTLRVWDLSCRSKIFSNNMNAPIVPGAAFLRLWVGEAKIESPIFSVAILSRQTSDISVETIILYNLHCSLGDKLVLLQDPSIIAHIPLVDGGCIDVKLTSDKIWILKENGLVLQNLFDTDMSVNEEETRYYTFQEEFVADQLFQSSESSPDDLLLMTHSMLSSSKDKILPVISSIFLRRLLHPGVHHTVSLRATLLDYNRHWTDTDFQSLTADGLKKEILSVIEYEGGDNLISIYCSWKSFCARYFQNWCKSNAPCGLLVESTTCSVGLIRQSSVSLFRSPEDIERLLDGFSDELGDLISFGLDIFHDKHEYPILVDLLRCVLSLSQQLGKPSSVIFYESLTHRLISPSEEIVSRVLKVLKTGYSSSITAISIADFGARLSWEKKLADNKNLRKFSIDMLLSLYALREKATSWSRVLNIIENYLKFLVPQKIIETRDGDPSLSINASILVHTTSQIAKVMFESSFDILLFLSYLVDNSGQVHMLPDDISKIQQELVPMIQEIISEWVIIHFLTTTPSESAAVEDFSSQLSSLQIGRDSNTVRKSWNDKLGKCDFPLAFVFLSNPQSFPSDHYRQSRHLPNLHEIITSTRHFSSWIIWGKAGNSCSFFSHSTELALILLRHGQYNTAEYLLNMVEAHTQKEKTLETIQGTDGRWCILHHLLGCCLLAQTQRGLQGKQKEQKISESVRCFFRASSIKDAVQALQSLPSEAGWPHLDFKDNLSYSVWKLNYYQWAMQIFEQYNISEGACQFALAALEQVEEALSSNEHYGQDPCDESAVTIKGRLWANVFKFTLDRSQFYEAYCAIISNPDEESKYICLRRFIIVLYECKAIKILCGGELPFIGLIDKVEQELAWKAERSDILAKPNLYKLLYAFEMNRHNWRKAASYIYRYSTRIKIEAAQGDYQRGSPDLQERLNGLCAAINALHLVRPAYAWIDMLFESPSGHGEHNPSKKAKKASGEEQEGFNGLQSQKTHCIDIEKIEDEFVLTSAEYLLSLRQVKWKFTEIREDLPNLVDLLVQEDLYDMAFTVLLRFFKGSNLKRELERVFCAMSLKCCPDKVDTSLTRTGDDQKHILMLTSSKNEMVIRDSSSMSSFTQQFKGNSHWVTLELYLEKYKGFHARLPLIVAENILRSDPQLELPLWLVNMFKDGRSERSWRMTGQESNPALLFRLYVDYGRYTEATNLLLEHIESYASMRPVDVINRKKPFAVWYPYTAIQQLWCKIEELIRFGHMVDQCEKLKKLLRGALLQHLGLLKVDSDDALASF